MKRLVFVSLMLLAVIASFTAALVVGPVFDVSIMVPGKLVGTLAGVLAFVVVLVIAVGMGMFIVDLIFHKTCRVMFADMLSYGWREWKYITPSLAAGVLATFFFGPWDGIGLAFVSYLLGSIAAYLICREKVIAVVGSELFYREATIQKG